MPPPDTIFTLPEVEIFATKLPIFQNTETFQIPNEIPLTINPIPREGLSQTPLTPELNSEKNLVSSVLSTMGIYGGLIETTKQMESSPILPVPSPSILNTNILGGLFGVSVPTAQEKIVSPLPSDSRENSYPIQMMESIGVSSLEMSQITGQLPR